MESWMTDGEPYWPGTMSTNGWGVGGLSGITAHANTITSYHHCNTHITHKCFTCFLIIFLITWDLGLRLHMGIRDLNWQHLGPWTLAPGPWVLGPGTLTHGRMGNNYTSSLSKIWGGIWSDLRPDLGCVTSMKWKRLNENTYNCISLEKINVLYNGKTLHPIALVSFGNLLNTSWN